MAFRLQRPFAYHVCGTAIVEVTLDCLRGTYGIDAVGEPQLMYGIGVFFALRQAMQAFNPASGETFHAPLTPERVLLALY